MGRRLHLLKRNDVFWWRRRLPRALQACGGGGEIRRSLGTAEPALARLRALRLTTASEDVLLSHAKTLSSARPLTRWERDQILGELYDRILDECQTWAAHRTVATEFLEPGHPEWDEDRYFNPRHLASFWTSLYQCGEYTEAADRLQELLASQGIDLPSDSIEFRRLAAEGMRYAIAAFQEAERTIVAGRLDEGTLARLARRHGQVPAAAPLPADGAATARPVVAVQPASPVPAFASAEPSVTTRQVPPAPIPRNHDDDPRLPSLETPLREIYQLFVDDKKGTSWKAEAVDDAWKALELFEALVGLRAIGEIAHGDAFTFRAQIQRLPKYHGKGRFKGMGSRESIKLAGELDAQLKAGLAAQLEAGEIDREKHDRRLAEGLLPRCGPKTVNKHLDYIGACLKWANKRFGWQLKNPFADNRYTKRELRKAGKARKAMKDAELKALFETPLFTGCSSENRRSLPGKLVLKDGFYWLPLVIGYTGGRLEEICQLTVSDIIQVDGIWCIKVTDDEDDQEAKSEAALRLIPLHPTLIKLGLVDRVLELRTKGKRRLFPDLAAGGRYGRYGYRLTKRWTHYRRRVGLYAPGKDFHTLRHSFNTHLLNKRVPVVWMSQIMGHASSSQTAGHAVNFETSSTYYGGAEIAMLHEAIEQFDFGLRFVEADGAWQIAR